jgi:hypothetical protein
LVDGSDYPKLFIETMKQHLDAAMDEARARDVKACDQGRFFFLKGGEVWPPNQADSPLATEIASVQVDNSKPPKAAESQQPEISQIDRILEGAERLNTSAQIAQIMSDLTRLAQAGDTRMVAQLYCIAVKAIVALNWLVMKKPEVLRPIARKTAV